MEWKRVKTILIGVLLITCLLLTGNILRQVRASKVQERQAVRDACGVAARTGVRIDAALVLALPERSAVLTAARDSVSERALADKLLGGEAALDEPGGGVSIYTGENGKMSVRRAGTLEISLAVYTGGFDRAGLSALLRNAGFDLSGSVFSQQGEVLCFDQYRSGRQILNCRLTCTAAGAGLHISGRWLLHAPAESERLGGARGELTLALAEAAAQAGATEITGLSAGYELTGDGVRRLELTPVLVAETDRGRIVFDTVTKKPLSGT